MSHGYGALAFQVYRTPERAFLIENNLNFLFERLTSEQRIELLAARDAVVLAVASAVGRGDQVLDACCGRFEWLAAEEALAALSK